MLLRVERERETGIRMQAALVVLVEQHGRDSGQCRVRVQHVGEYAFGHDLEPSSRAYASLEPHTVADCLARALL